MSFNIAIDGPAGAGKSTIAKQLAKELSFIYVDTGAMYRSMALYFMRNGIAKEDEAAISDACKTVEVSIAYENGEQQVLLNGENVSKEIRKEEVGKMASATSVYKEVRKKLVELQQKLAADKDVIMDGRDIGTCVLPNAQVKIYLTASVETRAERRYQELQEKGANNINLVTPTHFVVQIAQAIKKARRNGLIIPIVYNTGSYENIETLKLLDGLIDIYLPDMKYMDSSLSLKYSNAKDYFDVASKALDEMFKQVGKPVFDKRGIMKRGMIVRHLILPGMTYDSKNVIKYLYETFKDDIYISIMNQYTPLKQVEKYPEINRKVTDKEYDEVVDYAIELGVVNGFIQEGETTSESFIPEFDCEGV